MATSPNVWAPSFDRAGYRWLDNMQAEDILRVDSYGTRCILCESYKTHPAKEHADKHRAEFRSWKLKKQAEARAAREKEKEDK